MRIFILINRMDTCEREASRATRPGIAVTPNPLTMEQARWTERKFSFDFPVEWLPNILERLRGTSARLNDITGSLTEMKASVKINGKWSIKEHIGHLADLESLHDGRLDDFISRKKTLRPADMTNAVTFQADHNSRSLRHLINDFTVKRRHFIHRLVQMDPETHAFKSMHPRLRKNMRPADIAYFIAEHDDHHLASIRRLIEEMKH